MKKIWIILIAVMCSYNILAQPENVKIDLGKSIATLKKEYSTIRYQKDANYQYARNYRGSEIWMSCHYHIGKNGVVREQDIWFSSKIQKYPLNFYSDKINEFNKTKFKKRVRNEKKDRLDILLYQLFCRM